MVLRWLGKTPLPSRNRLMFLLVHEVAMSVEQICSLDWRDVLEQSGATFRAQIDVRAMYRRNEKGRPRALVPRLVEQLAAFHSECGSPSMGRVFSNRVGQALSAQFVHQSFKYWFNALGLERKSIHSVRRNSLARAVCNELAAANPRRKRAAASLDSNARDLVRPAAEAASIPPGA